MAFLKIFVTQQLLFLFSKHLDTMWNVTDCVSGQTDLCCEARTKIQKNVHIPTLAFEKHTFLLHFFRIFRALWHIGICFQICSLLTHCLLSTTCTSKYVVTINDSVPQLNFPASFFKPYL